MQSSSPIVRPPRLRGFKPTLVGCKTNTVTAHLAMSTRSQNRRTMKAAYLKQTGPPENIIYGDLPTPKPGPTQCLVKVGAVSLNPVDTYIRSGMVQMQLPVPFIVGCDLAGTVS